MHPSVFPAPADVPGGFSAFPLAASLHKGIAAMGFTNPRPIQAAALPVALAGRDVLGLAQTGTGKTAAFALPILERLLQRKAPGPRALVIAPTRELAIQIDEEFRKLGQFAPLRTMTIFGGVGMNPQIQALRRGVDIIVACPGRLLDHLGQGNVKLDKIEVLVLDEADQLFDMGFLPDVRRIMRALPADRQNMMFSATMPPEVRKLASDILRDPAILELANTTPAPTIEHGLYPIPESRKIDLLMHILKDKGAHSAIVFTRTKYRAKRLAQKLAGAGVRAVALQGNMSQNKREDAMRGFRQGRYEVLVATDIAARGIDVQQVGLVVNFDLPDTPEAYTHRVGRTGRAEREGTAHSFVNYEDLPTIRAIERKLGAPIPRVRVEGLTDERAMTAQGIPGTSGLDRPGERPGGRRGGRPGSRRGPGQGGGGGGSHGARARGAGQGGGSQGGTSTGTARLAARPGGSGSGGGTGAGGRGPDGGQGGGQGGGPLPGGA